MYSTIIFQSNHLGFLFLSIIRQFVFINIYFTLQIHKIHWRLGNWITPHFIKVSLKDRKHSTSWFNTWSISCISSQFLSVNSYRFFFIHCYYLYHLLSICFFSVKPDESVMCNRVVSFHSVKNSNYQHIALLMNWGHCTCFNHKAVFYVCFIICLEWSGFNKLF